MKLFVSFSYFLHFYILNSPPFRILFLLKSYLLMSNNNCYRRSLKVGSEWCLIHFKLHSSLSSSALVHLLLPPTTFKRYYLTLNTFLKTRYLHANINNEVRCYRISVEIQNFNVIKFDEWSLFETRIITNTMKYFNRQNQYVVYNVWII